MLCKEACAVDIEGSDLLPSLSLYPRHRAFLFAAGSISEPGFLYIQLLLPVKVQLLLPALIRNSVLMYRFMPILPVSTDSSACVFQRERRPRQWR
jgi:hypothetical protein